MAGLAPSNCGMAKRSPAMGTHDALLMWQHGGLDVLLLNDHWCGTCNVKVHFCLRWWVPVLPGEGALSVHGRLMARRAHAVRVIQNVA